VSDEYDFPARQEHNGQGRWISPDPMRGTGNKYVYAGNNPLSNVDPYGLFTYTPPLVGLADAMAWINSELDRPDPLEESESHAPRSTQIVLSEDAYLDRVDAAFEGKVELETPPVLQRQEAQAAQVKSEPAKSASNSSDEFIPDIVGTSVRRGHKWYSSIKHWFDNAVEAKELRDELNTDQTIQNIAAAAITQGDLNRTPQFIEIYSLEAENLNYDEGRLAGKVMAEVPDPPGTDKFGSAVFDFYGQKRDENNLRIDLLVQDAAQGLMPR
jgi:hypothetical protein